MPKKDPLAFLGSRSSGANRITIYVKDGRVQFAASSDALPELEIVVLEGDCPDDDGNPGEYWGIHISEEEMEHSHPELVPAHRKAWGLPALVD